MRTSIDMDVLECEACGHSEHFNSYENRSESLRERGTKCPACGDNGEFAAARYKAR